MGASGLALAPLRLPFVESKSLDYDKKRSACPKLCCNFLPSLPRISTILPFFFKDFGSRALQMLLLLLLLLWWWACMYVCVVRCGTSTCKGMVR